MADTPPRVSVAVAAERLDCSDETVRRRVDLYIRGDRSPKALHGGRPHPTGFRWVDERDVERAKLQDSGALPGDIGPDDDWSPNRVG